jgi:signal transduction histidine kinase
MNGLETRQTGHGHKLRSRRHWIEVSDLNWWLVFLVCTVLAFLQASTVYTTDLADRHPVRYYYPLIWEFTGYYLAFALLPLYVIGFGRLPIRRQNWYWTVPVHLAISVVFGIVHTLLMKVTRDQVYALFGLGNYDYGTMRYRFLMEYHKQFVAYWSTYFVLRGLAYYRQSRERDQEAAALKLKTSELQRQLSQVQLQALRSQLNPHFLFNTLNMVSSVMYEDVGRADQMIAALSRMLRMSLEEDVGAQVTMRRELEFVQCAVELVQARFQDRVAIDIHCAPDAFEELVPNLLLYTLIENAIKHHNLERASVIRVQARIERTDTMLNLDVLDNGPGIVDVRKAMRNGVGLSNTKARLEAFYGERHQFDVENRPEGGLHVHIGIPVANKPALHAV